MGLPHFRTSLTEVLGQRAMDGLWQDIRYGVRLPIRFPGVTAAALLA